MIRYLLTFALIISAYAADPLPAVRTPGGRGSWAGLVGVPDHLGGSGGSGPRRTTIYTNFSAGATFAQVQGGIDNCPSNQVVLLGAGDYNMGGNRLKFDAGDSGVTLRGAGLAWNGTAWYGLTRLTNTDTPSIDIGIWQWWEDEITTPSIGLHTNWTAGYTQGTTNITIASAGSYEVGDIVVLDQLNDTVDVVASAWGNASGGQYAGGYYTSVAFPSSGRDRYQYQPNRIYAISGNDITLYEPIYMPNWNAGGTNDPEIWKFIDGPVIGSAVEDIEVASKVEIHVGYGCWVSNIVTHIGSTHAAGVLRPYWSVRCTFEHNYYDGTVGEDNYGIESRASAGILVQHNISRGVNTGLNPSGSIGSVWAYNVMTGQDPFFGVILQGLLQHGGNPNMNLYEGNYSPAIGIDNTWGSSSYNTGFRSRAIGYNPDVGAGFGLQYAFTCASSNRYAASIGNVLGTTGIHTNYMIATGTGCSNNAIYYLGWWDVGCPSSPVPDPASSNTVILAYNWTSATSTNNGVVTDGFTANDLPDSYYLTGTPSVFGSLTFPPIDPDNPTYSNSYTNIPAGHADVLGVWPSGSASTTGGVIARGAALFRGGAIVR